ncbi:MAG: transglutaminase family protein [Bdellovibrionales bacterium]
MNVSMNEAINELDWVECGSVNKIDLPYLNSTEFCDSDNDQIRDLARVITRRAKNEKEAAIEVFEWVKERLVYRVGLYKEPASVSIQKMAGSCSNKANVFVALMRSLNVPAGYHISTVKTRDYFGPYCVERFSKFMSLKSYHVYAGVKLDGKWIKVDPTDDSGLTNGTKHIAPQAKPVFFDGENDAMLNLNSRHIIDDTMQCLSSIDDIFRRKVRCSAEAIEIMNLYMDFMRTDGKKHLTVPPFVEAFFEYFAQKHPKKYSSFLKLERQLEQMVYNRMSEPELQR